MKQARRIDLDILAIVACLMVVFFHCNGVFYTWSDSLRWKISLLERCVVSAAVPIFFMLSGAKLLPYRQRYSTKEYAKRRLLRVGLPFLFWNGVYVVYAVLMTGELPFSGVGEAVYMLLNSQFHNRYWFFIPLFALYLAIPVLSLLLQVKGHRRILWYAVLVSFVLRWVLEPVLMRLDIPWNDYLTMPVSGGFVTYALFGYLVSTEKWSKKCRIGLYLAALAATAIAFLDTVNLSARYETNMAPLLSYEYFPSGLMGAAIFVFFRHKSYEKLQHRECLCGWINKTADAGMGIWMTHSFGILLMSWLTGLTQDSYLWAFGIPVVVFLLCLIGVLVWKKLPALRRLV